MRDFGGSPFTALFVALAVGAAFGIVQGFLVAYLEIQPFIVTLAGMFFARGMTQIISSDHLNVEGNEAFDKILHAKINSLTLTKITGLHQCLMRTLMLTLYTYALLTIRQVRHIQENN